MRDVEFSHTHASSDCFVLCGSAVLSKQTLAQFEGADACVRIVDVANFFRAATNALNKITPVAFRGIARVVYQPRVESWNGISWGQRPVWIKELQFVDQHEIRAVWLATTNDALSPQFIVAPELGRCCVMVEP